MLGPLCQGLNDAHLVYGARIFPKPGCPRPLALHFRCSAQAHALASITICVQLGQYDNRCHASVVAWVIWISSLDNRMNQTSDYAVGTPLSSTRSIPGLYQRVEQYIRSIQDELCPDAERINTGSFVLISSFCQYLLASDTLVCFSISQGIWRVLLRGCCRVRLLPRCLSCEV